MNGLRVGVAPMSHRFGVGGEVFVSLGTPAFRFAYQEATGSTTRRYWCVQSWSRTGGPQLQAA